MFGASSLSMGGSISTPRPSTQPKQYHELKQYKKIKLWYRTKHLKSLQTIIKKLLTFDFWECSLNGKRGIVSLVNRLGLLSVPNLRSIQSHQIFTTTECLVNMCNQKTENTCTITHKAFFFKLKTWKGFRFLYTSTQGHSETTQTQQCIFCKHHTSHCRQTQDFFSKTQGLKSTAQGSLKQHWPGHMLWKATHTLTIAIHSPNQVPPTTAHATTSCVCMLVVRRFEAP